MKTAVIAVALAAALAGVAMAAPQDGQPVKTRTGVDANRDGVIERAEAARHPRLAERFDTLDANKDGRLDRGERPHRGRQGKRLLSMIDVDKDGRISRAEAGKHPKFAARFDTLDANKDGVLDAGERPQHRGRHGKRLMSMIDVDKDGRISRSEAGKHPKFAARFDTLDANRDGVLDAGERPQHRGRHGKRLMSMIDVDKDGRISRAEAGKHPKFAARFDALDANKDGVLDAGERPRGRGKGDRPKLDSNGDGRITQAEAATHPRLKERFASVDRNRDGVLTREELQQARAQRREAAPAR